MPAGRRAVACQLPPAWMQCARGKLSSCFLTRRLCSQTHVLCSQNFLEDVAAIAADSGCTAIVCLPLLAAADKAGDRGDGSSGDGDSSADVAPCLGALTVGFSSDGHLTSA